jgi:hypothetical protein
MMCGGPAVLLGAVTAFRGPYWALSNFNPHAITVGRDRYPTVEH